AAIAVVVVGLKVWHWYIVEMGAVFLILAVVLAIVARLNPDEAAKAFCIGASELTTTALLIGFARSILILLEEGQVIDTIVYGVSLPLEHAGSALAAVGMLFFQSACNLFIPSGSGQAYVTMPVMAPLGDLVGVNRQVAVLAYQMGDGLTNILVPTNAVLIGILTMARIPYERWLRFILPFMVKAWILCSLALAVAVWIGFE
ncbi:MAG: AbgT family transporter, partial [Acidobacteriota bacterium]